MHGAIFANSRLVGAHGSAAASSKIDCSIYDTRMINKGKYWRKMLQKVKAASAPGCHPKEGTAVGLIKQREDVGWRRQGLRERRSPPAYALLGPRRMP